MHLLLTDRTACPRCGPAFGLILLADHLDNRRVREGVLGCSNCRERYPIRDGVADLRPPPRLPLPEPESSTPLPRPESSTPGKPADVADPRARAAADAADPRALTAAAVSGVGPGGGKVLVMGAAASLSGAMADVVPEGVEVVTAQPGWPVLPCAPGVSPTIVGSRLPFFDATFAGVVLLGSDAGTEALREAARVLLRGHRVVLLEPPIDAQARLGAVGLLRFVHGEGVAAAGR